MTSEASTPRSPSDLTKLIIAVQAAQTRRFFRPLGYRPAHRGHVEGADPVQWQRPPHHLRTAMGHLRVMAGSNITCIGDFTHEDSFWPRNDAHIYGRRCERPLRSHRWELVQITTQTARQSPNQGVRNPPSQMTKSALSAGPRWPFGKRSTDFFVQK